MANVMFNQPRFVVPIQEAEDFLPIVKLNKVNKGVNAICSDESCDSCKKEILDLGIYFDQGLRTYTIPEIVIAKSSKSYIPLKNIAGYSGKGKETGILEFKCSDAKVVIRLLEKSTPKDCDDNTAIYDFKHAKFEDEYTLEISHTLKRGTKFTLEVNASNDNEGQEEQVPKIIKCGKFVFKVVERDVFMEEEVQKLIDETKLVASNMAKLLEDRPKEYQRNYCMHGADRALGKLLDNKTIFYTYDDTIGKVVNLPKPAFTNATKRCTDLKAKGYVFSIDTYNGYSVTQEDKLDKYQNKPTRNVSIEADNSITKLFQKSIDKKIGYHVYYVSIANAFHTMYLLINNTDPCKPIFSLYDDFGIGTNCEGSLGDIDNAFIAQSDWLLKWAKKNYKIWTSLLTTAAKIQRNENE